MRRKRFFRKVVQECPERIFVSQNNSTSFRDWFNKLREDKPLVLELGIGTGDFLLEQAQSLPEQFFLGIEVKPDRMYRAYHKATERKLRNIAFLKTPIELLPEYHIPKVETLYVLFPDPWPKRRHSSRRLTSAFFLDIYQSFLRPSGSFILKTDDRLLFLYSLESLIDQGWQIIEQEHDYKTDPEFQTAYERKFLNKNKNIYYLEAKQPQSRKSFRKFLSRLIHSFPRS